MIKLKSDESGSATMKQLLSLFLVLSLTACAAGPRTARDRTVTATEEHVTAQPGEAGITDPVREAEHDPASKAHLGAASLLPEEPVIRPPLRKSPPRQRTPPPRNGFWTPAGPWWP